MSSLSRRWGLLLQQHPCVDRVLVAVLVEGELVLRLVIIDLVVDKEVGGGSLLRRKPERSDRSARFCAGCRLRLKNLSLTAWDPTNLPKNLSLSSDLLRS